tara:strand:- start:4257 stop:5315 length:1059 start_codon:yes stop_codon:yes gene_type:complete
MINYCKKKIINILLRSQSDKPIKIRNKINNNNSKTKFVINKFGEKNKNKIFYVIRVDHKGGAGLFSNVLYVLNHLKISEKHGFIPIVDMENFPTRYNENERILSTKNSWEYYFEPISKFKLKDVYSSKNVISTTGSSNDEMSKNYKNDKNLKLLFHKYIKIKDMYLDNAKKFTDKNFKRNKVLGVHFRGTDMKKYPNHPLPPTVRQITNLIDSAIAKYKFNKIFLVTEEIKYLRFLQNRYGEMICFRNSFRSSKLKVFDLKVRKFHRYLMGVDALEDTILMSKLDFLICSRSNMSEVASLMLRKKTNVMEIKNGFNPNKILISQFNWYIKQLLPKVFGGFEKKINLKFRFNK